MTDAARIELLKTLYAGFNARDIDLTLSGLAPDVDWPKAFAGGRAVGHAAVREYWTEQWTEIDPHVEPVGFETDGEGRIRVTVHQVVEDLNGAVLFDGNVFHVYTFRDGLAARMDVESD